ncbi:hypothetical protein ACFOWA_19925 [Pedobacter lithocola]|uniref:Uncharacterized protein n=1 Tax=Pedobacter lithocola TaxID=1908239 RepID=A0ABV8PH33_9SPHI
MKDLKKLSRAEMLEMLTNINEILDRDYKNDQGHEPAALQVEAIGLEFFDEGIDLAIFYEFVDLSKVISICTTNELLDQIQSNINQYGAIYQAQELRQLKLLIIHRSKHLEGQHF